MSAMLLPAAVLRVRVTAVAGAAVLCLATAACSSSSKSTGGGGSAPPATTGAPTVHVKNFSFDPGTLTVKAGTKVTWDFEDSAKHNVTDSKGTFKSTDLSSGGSYSFTFNSPGTYNYICTIHQYMTGKVVVQ